MQRLIIRLTCLSLLSAGAAAAAPRPDSMTPEAQVERGWSLMQRGAFEDAAVAWKGAAQAYQEEGKLTEQTEAVTYLAYAYESLGQYRKALENLDLALALAERSGDRARMATILGRLGSGYLAVGQQDAAEKFLEEAIALARELKAKDQLASLLNDYGNLLFLQKQYDQAMQAYSESAQLAEAARNDSLATSALINVARTLNEKGQHQEAKDRLDQAVEKLQRVPPSHEKAYALIAIGLAYHELRAHLSDADGLSRTAAARFTEAARMAEQLGDARAASYAWGYLGHVSEIQGRYPEALELTRKAVLAAQRVQAPESLYRWQWQSGRLLKALGDLEGAIASYRRAVALLQSVRPEMGSGFGGSQASFRESVGPLYFELADLLLQRTAARSGIGVEEVAAYLIEARETVELLKAAELRDYFRDECVDGALSRSTKLEEVSRTAVVVYPILLPDRLELLVSLPAGLKQVRVPVSAETITKEIRAFRSRLEKRTTREYLPHAQRLYEWLVRPLEADLVAMRTDTIVFVPDAALRTIPLAALHDGKDFLISKYAVATSPGLSLTDPRPLKRKAIRMLQAGLTESVQGFPALPNVSFELDAIQKLYPGEAMVNKEFLLKRFAQELQDKDVTLLHIASHGEFKNVVEKSFILTYDDKLTMNRLDEYIGLLRFREEPLELLTLSACETAAGDDRAALGLAGVAIKAGARSALATLWTISDEASSDLVAEFYAQLQTPGVSKAVALQRAQVKVLSDPRYKHPGYWSPFLLLNNWL